MRHFLFSLSQFFASPLGWQKIGTKRGEHFDPPVVATRQPGAIDIERLQRSHTTAEQLHLTSNDSAYSHKQRFDVTDICVFAWMRNEGEGE